MAKQLQYEVAVPISAAAVYKIKSEKPINEEELIKLIKEKDIEEAEIKIWDYDYTFSVIDSTEIEYEEINGIYVPDTQEYYYECEVDNSQLVKISDGIYKCNTCGNEYDEAYLKNLLREDD